MKDQEKETENSTQKKADPKTLLGTEEKSAWEKAVATIAGDNKLMGVALKILLSPITLIVGAGALIYCFFKIKNLSTEIEKLKSENKKISDEKEDMEEEFQKIKKKYKKQKEFLANEKENGLSILGIVPQNLIPTQPEKKKMYNTAYLD